MYEQMHEICDKIYEVKENADGYITAPVSIN